MPTGELLGRVVLRVDAPGAEASGLAALVREVDGAVLPLVDRRR